MVLSITRIPDHGVEFLSAKLWGGDEQADVLLAGGFAFLLPARTDFDALGQNLEVGLAVRDFTLVWHKVIPSLNTHIAQEVFVTTVVFCKHYRSQSLEVFFWMFA